MRAYECDTPALIVDMDILESNIRRMAEYFRGKKAKLRPHVKVHKSPFFAHKQIAAGAKGITCAKLSEAEVMANAGIRDILIANEIVGEQKIRKLVGLAKQSNITVCVDDADNAKQISTTASRENSKLSLLVELNLGVGFDGILDRCGVLPGKRAVEIAREISHLKNVEFKGLMGYEGSLRKFPDFKQRKEAADRALRLLIQTRDEIEDRGLSVDTVSCGGTMSYNIASEIPGVTEVQAGSYIFMDATYHKNQINFDIALTLLTSIISVSRHDKLIVDAGLKAISVDHGLPLVKNRPELECVALNAEHGHLSKTLPTTNLERGEKLELVPTHVDTTTCLHDKYILTRNEEVEELLEIAGRGKLQ